MTINVTINIDLLVGNKGVVVKLCYCMVKLYFMQICIYG